MDKKTSKRLGLPSEQQIPDGWITPIEHCTETRWSPISRSDLVRQLAIAETQGMGLQKIMYFRQFCDSPDGSIYGHQHADGAFHFQRAL